MALVSEGWFLEVEFEDNGANITRRTYDLVAEDETEASAAVVTVLAAVAGVSDALVKGYRVGEKFGQDSGSFPASGVQIENLALLVTQLETFDKSATYSIPAPKAAIFTASSGAAANIVNIGNAAVIAYHALFGSGGVATLSDGEEAGALQKGRRVHRKSDRG